MGVDINGVNSYVNQQKEQTVLQLEQDSVSGKIQKLITKKIRTLVKVDCKEFDDSDDLEKEIFYKEIEQIDKEIGQISNQEQFNNDDLLIKKIRDVEMFTEMINKRLELKRIIEQKVTELMPYLIEKQDKIEEIQKRIIETQKRIIKERDNNIKQEIYEMVQILKENIAKQKKIMTEKDEIIEKGGVEEYQIKKAIVDFEVEKWIWALTGY